MKKYVLVVLVLGCVVFSVNSTLAGGLGIAFPAAVGSADYDLYEMDARHFGVNFIFDSNVARRSVFNYRLNVGIEFFDHEYEDEYYDDSWGFLYTEYEYNDGIRIVTDHTFGFGIIKSRVVRWWLGPTIRLGFVSSDEAGLAVGAGFTPLGLNFNFGPVFTIGLEAG